MSVPIIPGLAAIAGDHDAIICDVWGVLHDGRTPYPGVAEALARFRTERGPVVLLSNAPRPAAAVASLLARMGFPDGSWDGIVTSGDVARGLVADEAAAHAAPFPLLFIGPPRDAGVIAGLPVTLAPEGKARLALLTGLYDDDRETPAHYAGLLARLRALSLPLVCANPDLVVQRGDQLIWCAGAVAAGYQAMGGSVTYTGKPHGPAFTRAVAALETLAGRSLAPQRILVIGDGLKTDMKGATLAGLASLCVTGGIHAAEFGPADAPDPARVAAALAAEGATARAALPRLVW